MFVSLLFFTLSYFVIPHMKLKHLISVISMWLLLHAFVTEASLLFTVRSNGWHYSCVMHSCHCFQWQMFCFSYPLPFSHSMTNFFIRHTVSYASAPGYLKHSTCSFFFHSVPHPRCIHHFLETTVNSFMSTFTFNCQLQHTTSNTFAILRKLPVESAARTVSSAY